jgi:hypothetical protein
MSCGTTSAEPDAQAPRLTRRTIDATHWSALTEKGPIVARMISQFVALA